MKNLHRAFGAAYLCTDGWAGRNEQAAFAGVAEGGAYLRQGRRFAPHREDSMKSARCTDAAKVLKEDYDAATEGDVHGS